MLSGARALALSLLTSLALGARSIRRSKLRAALTVLGITIGIAAVLLVTALGRGARERVVAEVANLGSNSLAIFPHSVRASGARTAAGARLSERDAQALVRESTSIKASTGFLRAQSRVVFEGLSSSPTIIGTRLPYFEIRAWAPARGGLWSASAEATAERVVVLGAQTAKDLFGGIDPLGRTVRLGGAPFRVIGVLEEKGMSPFGQSQDDIALMPVTTMRARVLGQRRDDVVAILFSAKSAETTTRAKRQAEEILRQRHRIKEGEEDDFRVRSQAEFMEMQSAIYGALTLLLSGVAAVSLIVGGIGVMNIMLVSVTERTREIGIRMAIGARERDILAQFLLEAVMLGLLGGTAGVALGYAAILGLGAAFEWPMRLDLDALVVAVGVSTGVGLVFGFLPARRAARMSPVQALGRE